MSDEHTPELELGSTDFRPEEIPEWVDVPSDDAPSGAGRETDVPATSPGSDGPDDAAGGPGRGPRADRDDEEARPFWRRFRPGHLHERGGLGRVWWAADRRLGQAVAVKELRPELATTPAHRERFLREARITAQLAHPGVAAVLDIDEGDADRAPAFAMRFVPGRGLGEAARAYHEACRSGLPDPLELLRLLQAFVTVCEVVAYAHARGVLHRDLKGSNVRLGEFGEVVLLDWGLARALDEPGEEAAWPVEPDLDDDEPPPTQVGHVVGTPGYAPPEQVLGQLDRIGRRSDVFGLGALLYEILTGRAPFGHKDRDEAIRRTCAGELDRPRALAPHVPPALEAICLKALSTDPADRYDSASDLAAEVRRHLADEPVAAYPEPLRARVGRWGRRHRTAAAVGLALLVALTLGLAAGALLLDHQRRRVEDANRVAEENFRIARDTARRMIHRVNALPLADVPGGHELRRQLAAEAKELYKRFLQTSFADRDVRLEASEVYESAGLLVRNEGQFDLAMSDLRWAERHLTQPGGGTPADPEMRRRLADVLTQLGDVYRARGRPVEAEQELRRALGLARPLYDARPADDGRRRVLAGVLASLMSLEADRGQFDRAIVFGEEAVALYAPLVARPDAFLPDFVLLGSARGMLARAYAAVGRLGDADWVVDEALATARKMMSDPTREHQPDRRFGLVLALAQRADRLASRGDRDAEAEGVLDEAIGRSERLVEDFPVMVAYRMLLADGLATRGRLRGRAGRLPEAEADLVRAINLAGAIPAEASRGDTTWRLGQTFGELGRVVERLGRPDEAREHLRRAVKLQSTPPAVAGFPASDDFLESRDRDTRDLRRLEEARGEGRPETTAGPGTG